MAVMWKSKFYIQKIRKDYKSYVRLKATQESRGHAKLKSYYTEHLWYR